LSRSAHVLIRIAMSKLYPTKSHGNHLDSLVLLRSIAVIMVCCCHFGYPLLSNNFSSVFFKLCQQYGGYGVQIFFVISGFIIPYSLLKGNYRLINYPQFLYKRLVRLHPPYLAALALTLAIMLVSYRARHVPFPEDITSILRSVFYLHSPPDNPVFWTLLTEAQYYIFIGIFYTLLMSHVRIAYFIVIPAIIFLGHTVLNPYILISSYVAYFFIGNVVYMIHTNNGEKISNYFTLIGILLFVGFFHGTPPLVFSTVTILFILLFKKPIPSLPAFIGKISYSIYLIHFPLGVKLINFFKPRINPSYNWLLFSATTLLLIGTSWAFYKLFEEFSERFSKRIKYKPTLVAASQGTMSQVPAHS
jgi:peptidoglycan/LPS O-acetylase OafA/YrhL